jgi:hypothetical protein
MPRSKNRIPLEKIDRKQLTIHVQRSIGVLMMQSTALNHPIRKTHIEPIIVEFQNLNSITWGHRKIVEPQFIEEFESMHAFEAAKILYCYGNNIKH